MPAATNTYNYVGTEKIKGKGVSVAILDTGLDVTKLPCYSTSSCPATQLVELGTTKDGLADDYAGVMDGRAYHGTEVAKRVLMYAPGTKIIAMDVIDATGFNALGINQALIVS